MFWNSHVTCARVRGSSESETGNEPFEKCARTVVEARVLSLGAGEFLGPAQNRVDWPSVLQRNCGAILQDGSIGVS